MKIAIPVAGGILSSHFGHAPAFAFVDVDREARLIQSVTEEPAPEHQHGLLPRWLSQRGVDVVIAGGMGEHARQLLSAASITVHTGVQPASVETVVQQFLEGTLATGPATCQHRCQH